MHTCPAKLKAPLTQRLIILFIGVEGSTITAALEPSSKVTLRKPIFL